MCSRSLPLVKKWLRLSREISHNAERAAIASQDSAKSAQDGGLVVMKRLAAWSTSQIRIPRLSLKWRVSATVPHRSGRLSLLFRKLPIRRICWLSMRQLAERTRQSTEEISQIISVIQAETKDALMMTEASKSKVLQGLERAREAGKALEFIITVAYSSPEMVALVATVATEQNRGLASVLPVRSGGGHLPPVIGGETESTPS